jgi:hypothetical protein
VDRWTSAWKVFWRAEPAGALVAFLLLAAATTGYVDLCGGHLASGPGSLHTLIRQDASPGYLALYAFFCWRMWLGGGYSWTLSLVWKLGFAAAAADACYQAPGLLEFGLLALALAGLCPLFTAAVLDRVTDRSHRYATIRAIRRAFAAGYGQPRGHRGRPGSEPGVASPS